MPVSQAEPIVCQLSPDRVVAWVPFSESDIDPNNDWKDVIQLGSIPCPICKSENAGGVCADCQRDAYYT